MKKLIISMSLLFIAVFTFAQGIGGAPTITDVSMVQEGSRVFINYSLQYSTNPTKPYNHITRTNDLWHDPDFPHRNAVPCNVTFVISDDSGETFKIFPDPANLRGDVGDGIEPGLNKQIIWNITNELQVIRERFSRVRVIARRSDEMAYVAGGTYNNGTNNVTLTGDILMGRHQITQVEYMAVMLEHPPEGFNFPNNPLRPAEQVNWFDAIEYCNRRSMQEGFTPVYSYTAGEIEYGTNTVTWPDGWKNVNANHLNVSCNWDANGYRLPTEAEWEWSARGGVPAQNAGTINTVYSGSNTINEVAWYRDSQLRTATHIIGKKKSNELGLYDMSGNVFEWNWDIHSTVLPQGENPTGPVAGTFRMGRGGSWSSTNTGCTVSFRSNAYGAAYRSAQMGFRVCRIAP